MKKIFTLLFLIHTYQLTAQVVTYVAPLKPGNKWVYNSSVVFQSEILKFEVLDSIKIINGIPFYALYTGPNFSGINGYVTLLDNGFYASYEDVINDSLYTYFKLNPTKGNQWLQNWKNGVTLLSTITDTLESIIFGKHVIIYVIDRLTIENGDTSSFGGSREYWSKEFGLIEGRYEQAEDHLIGCVIDGILYGDTNTVSIDEEGQLPDEFVLYQNYPNPFNPSTVISWQMNVGSNAQLKVYDLLGREIKTLVNQYYSTGNYKTTFNAEGLSSGIYFYRIITDNFSAINKMVLVL